MNFIQNLNLNLTGDNLRELLKALGESRLPARKSEMAALLNEIVVTDASAFSAGDAALLKRFATQVSDSVWKMDQKSIFQALENGDTLDDIQLVLHAGAANEIPATVLALMDQTAARARTAIQSEEALAITFRDEPSALLVEQDPAIRPATLGRNGSTVFFRKKNVIKVQGGLRKLGILLP
jgi:hypothetical protein